MSTFDDLYEDQNIPDWLNYPNTGTPINQINLRAVNAAIQKLFEGLYTESRDKVTNDTYNAKMAQLDATDATKQSIDGTLTWVKDITFNSSTGVFTVTRVNNTTFTVDTKLEKLAINFTYISDPTDPHYQSLAITLDDGTVQYVDMSALLTQYEFSNTSTIQMTVDNDGKVSASIVNHSIGADQLETNYLANITQQQQLATQAKTDAQTAANSAQGSATGAAGSAGTASNKATLAESWAVGGTNTRQGEDTDNAKYYAEQAKDAAESLGHPVVPKGTVTFANLPSLSSVVGGWMYNISNSFTSDNRFKDGAGINYGAGNNVYCLEDKTPRLLTTVYNDLTQDDASYYYAHDDSGDYVHVTGIPTNMDAAIPLLRVDATIIASLTAYGYVGFDYEAYSLTGSTFSNLCIGAICNDGTHDILVTGADIAFDEPAYAAEILASYNEVISYVQSEQYTLIDTYLCFSGNVRDIDTNVYRLLAFNTLADWETYQQYTEDLLDITEIIELYGDKLWDVMAGPPTGGADIEYYASEQALDADWSNVPEGAYVGTPDPEYVGIAGTAVAFDGGVTDLEAEDVNSAIIEAYNKTRIINSFFKFMGNTVKDLNITGGVDTKPRFGVSEDTIPIDNATGNVTIDAPYGCNGTVSEASSTLYLTLESKAMYVLFCSSYTLSNGNLYGATAQLITTHGLATGTPNNVTLGQTSNAPATISLVANNILTIKNGNAGRATQYNLIRVL